MGSSSLKDIDGLLSLLRDLSGEDVLEIGEVPDHVLSIWVGRHTNRVVITAERRAHYLLSHPEVIAYEQDMLLAILDPDAVHRYEADAEVANLYREVGDGRYIVVSLLTTSNPGLRNSVMSARISRTRQRNSGIRKGLEVWKR